MITDKQIVDELAIKTWNWLKTKYSNLPDKPEVEFKLSYTCRFARYSPKGPHCDYVGNIKQRYISIIRLDMRRRYLLLYQKKSLGTYERKVPNLLLSESLQFQLVHELTHHIQDLQKRGYGEVETTKNEIEYAKENYAYIYNKIIKEN